MPLLPSVLRTRFGASLMVLFWLFSAYVFGTAAQYFLPATSPILPVLFYLLCGFCTLWALGILWFEIIRRERRPRELTPEQWRAIQALLGWSTIPRSTLQYAALMVAEIERKSFEQPTPCEQELNALAQMMLDLCDAFDWHQFKEGT